MFSDKAPEDGAEGHASLEGHEVGAEGTGLNPGGDSQLNGDVEGGHGACPRESGEKQGEDDNGRYVDKGQDQERYDVIKGGGGDDVVGGEAAANAGEDSGGDDGPEAEGAVEDAVAKGSLTEVGAGYDGEERPDGGDEEGVGEGSDEGGLELGRITDVAQAGTDGASDAFGGERGLEEGNTLPVVKDPDDTGKRDGVKEEDGSGAGVDALLEGCDHESAEGRAYSSGEVVAGGVEGDGVGDELAGDQLGDDGLPRRVVHGRADIEQEREGEQCPGGDVADEGEDGEDAYGDEHPGLPEDEELAAVEDVGGGSGE